MNSRGKNICKELKAVRKRIAEENGIELEIPECTYQGPCKGTCPRCESEVQYIEDELARRIRLGKVATVAGLALGLAVSNGAKAQSTDTLLRQPMADASPSSGEELPDSVPPRFSVPRKLRPFRPPLTPPDSGGELRRLAPPFGWFGASKRGEWRRYSGRLAPLFGINTDTDVYTCFYRFLTRTVCAQYARTP